MTTPKNPRNEREAAFEGFEGTPLEIEELDADDRRFLGRVVVCLVLALVISITVLAGRGCA